MERIYNALCECLPEPDPDYKDRSAASWSLLRLAFLFFGALGLALIEIHVESPQAIEKKKQEERNRVLMIQLQKDAREGKTGKGLQILFGVAQPDRLPQDEAVPESPALKGDPRHPSQQP